MEYLGKITHAPNKVEKNIDCSRKFYEPILFEFYDEEGFNSFYFKTNKIMNDNYDKNNGRCIVEDNERTKYIIDIEQINLFHDSLTADVMVCGIKKLK